MLNGEVAFDFEESSRDESNHIIDFRKLAASSANLGEEPAGFDPKYFSLIQASKLIIFKNNGDAANDLKDKSLQIDQYLHWNLNYEQRLISIVRVCTS